jgi:hypothetical protein
MSLSNVVLAIPYQLGGKNESMLMNGTVSDQSFKL